MSGKFCRSHALVVTELSDTVAKHRYLEKIYV